MNKSFISNQKWIKTATLVPILLGFVTACTQPAAENPNPNPVVVAPAPQPTATSTVVVTPTPQPTVTNTVVVTPTPQPTATSTVVIREPITDLVVINTAPDKATLVNRRVKFTGTKVLSVVGDRPFWVGRSNNERLFVVLDPKLDSGAAEKKVVIKPGQSLDLTGVLKPVPSTEQAQKQWQGLNASEAQALTSQAVYLQADQINFK